MAPEEPLDLLLRTGAATWASPARGGSVVGSQTSRPRLRPPDGEGSGDEDLAGGKAGEADFRWSLEALRGLTVELLGSGLTAATRILVEAQQSSEPAVWIATGPSTFFAPDLVRQGVDLDALPIVRAPDSRAAFTAADELLRSGSFGLCVLDETDAPLASPLDPGRAGTPGVRSPERWAKPRAGRRRQVTTSLSVQVRLANLARRHRSVLLWLRTPGATLRDPLVQAGLRVHARCVQSAGRQGPTGPSEELPNALHPLFECRLDLLKSKGRRFVSDSRFLAEAVPGIG